MMKLLRYFILNSEEDTNWQKNNIDPNQNLLNHEYFWHDKKLFEFNDSTRLKDSLHFNGKDIIVHKNFRLMIINTNLNFSFSHSIFTKFIFIQCEIEDEFYWK